MNKVNWKIFGYESEHEYDNCIKNCDYMNNEIAIDNKKIPPCADKGLDFLSNCIIWVYTQKIKTRIEIERGEQTPLIYCKRSGKNKGCKYDFGLNDDMEV